MPTTVKIKLTKNDMVYFKITGAYTKLNVFVHRLTKETLFSVDLKIKKVLVIYLPNRKKEFVNLAPLRDATYQLTVDLDGHTHTFDVERKRP